jgi:hypothetical protein
MKSPSADTTSRDWLAGSPLQRAARLLNPGLIVRMIAHARRRVLDRALMDNADPAASPLVAARAAQLSRASTRALIAEGLERMARSADGPTRRLRIPPSRGAVLRSRSELFAIAETLRGDRALYARGIATLGIILSDGTGPAYTDPRGDALAMQLKLARARLTG